MKLFKQHLMAASLGVILTGCATVGDVSQNTEYEKPAATRDIENKEIVVMSSEGLKVYRDKKPISIHGFQIPAMSLSFGPGKDYHGFGRRAQVNSGPAVPERLDIFAQQLFFETGLFDMENPIDVKDRSTQKFLANGKNTASIELTKYKIHLNVTYLQWDGGTSRMVKLAGGNIGENIMGLDVALSMRLEYLYPNKNVPLFTATVHKDMKSLMSNVSVSTVLNSNFAGLSNVEKFQTHQASAILQAIRVLVGSVAGYVNGEDLYSGQDVETHSKMSFAAHVYKVQLEHNVNSINQEVAFVQKQQQQLAQLQQTKQTVIAERQKLAPFFVTDENGKQTYKAQLDKFVDANINTYPTEMAVRIKHNNLIDSERQLDAQINQLAHAIAHANIPGRLATQRGYTQEIKNLDMVKDINHRHYFTIEDIKRHFGIEEFELGYNYIKEFEELSYRSKLKLPHLW